MENIETDALGSWPLSSKSLDSTESQDKADAPASGNDADETEKEEKGKPLYQAEESRVLDQKLNTGRKEQSLADLPAEIIEQILYLTDPETFASLVLLNRAWRSAAQNPHIYAHHLSRCPSFSISNSVIPGPFTEESLPQLKRRFWQEIKRNLFVAYLRPRRTIINIISTTTSSSAAFPGGEAFDFAFSPKGQWCLALSSSRIVVLDTASPAVSVRRELKVLRRPPSAVILDDGSLLAVLSDNHHVNIYNLSDLEVKHLRLVSLDNSTHTIAISPHGEVLAAAHDGGVEVHSLAASALVTDQRGVKCDRVESLSFSSDGTMLLGTTYNSKSASTVVLSAPFYTEGEQDLAHEELISNMWTSQILFPNSSRDCSHATLLPHHQEGDANWTFTYDRVFESFRAVRTDDLRNGTTYFTGPKPATTSWQRRSKSRLMPCTAPAANERGELVAAGFLGTEVWLYGVPEDLDTISMSHMDDGYSQIGTIAGSSATPPMETPPATGTARSENTDAHRLPQWQVLVDKHRNVFARGRRVAQLPGVSSMCWVTQKYDGKGPRSGAERLIIAAPGGVSGSSDLGDEQLASADGGRLMVLDFSPGADDGKCDEVVIEVGQVSPEILQEQNMDMATEIAIVRRRTIAQRRDELSRNSVAEALRPLPDASGDIPAVPTIPEVHSSVGFGLDATATEASPVDESASPMASPTEGLSLQEVSEALDGPYSHTQPRSRISLYRSATAVAANRRHNPPQVPASGRVEFRRADGRGELPHESDADNWVPPPPPYTPDPDVPLPEHLRLTLLSRPARFEQRPGVPRRPLRASTMSDNSVQRAFSLRRSPLDLEQTVSRTRQPQAQWPNSGSPIGPRGLQWSNTRNPLNFNDLPTGPAYLPLPGPNHISPLRQIPRPRTAMEGSSSNIPGQVAGLTTPISPIPESLHPGTHSRGHSISLPSSPINAGFPTSHLTLSGSNLQQRLDYLLPPPPQEPNNVSAVSPPLPSEESGPAAAPQLSIQTHLPTMPSLPSPQQLANLQNRYSQMQALPSNRPARPYTSEGYPGPAPPRAALGAAGSRISSSPHTIEAPARSLSRNNSRGSNRSFSASTPNLLRPTPRRLDTIHSVTSILTNTRSRSQDIVDTRPASLVRSRSMGSALPEDEIVPARRSWMGGKRGKRQKSGGLDGGAEGVDTEVVREPEGKKKKGVRCVVM